MSGTEAPERGKPARRSYQPVTLAYQHIVRSQLGKLHERAADVRTSTDIEAVHRLRVTVRRVRSAFRLMDKYFPRGQLRELRAGARELAQALGAVRDLDVALAHLDTYRAGLLVERQAALALLTRDWRARRQRAFWDLLAHINGEAFRQWTAQLAAFAVLTMDNGSPRVCDAVPLAIWRQYSVLRAYEPRLADAPLPVLHALRIEAKRLRYILEFFEDGLGADGKAAIELLTGLQEALGRLHDVDVIGAQLAQQATNAEIFAYGTALNAEEMEQRTAALAGFEAVCARPFRVALAQAVAAL